MKYFHCICLIDRDGSDWMKICGGAIKRPRVHHLHTFGQPLLWHKLLHSNSLEYPEQVFETGFAVSRELEWRFKAKWEECPTSLSRTFIP
jgi:hypothetical protein